MAWRIRGLLGAVALAVLTSCGVTEDEAVKLREGENLLDEGVDPNSSFCTTLGCPDYAKETPEGTIVLPMYCLEVFFDYGRSPALCLLPEVCNRLECVKEGGRCALFDGFPGQVKCVRD
jgi:hypothetical protein